MPPDKSNFLPADTPTFGRTSTFSSNYSLAGPSRTLGYVTEILGRKAVSSAVDILGIGPDPLLKKFQNARVARKAIPEKWRLEMLGYLKHEDFKTRTRALDHLATISSIDGYLGASIIKTDTLPMLVACLESSDPRINLASVLALLTSVLENDRAADIILTTGTIPKLLDCLESTESGVWSEAANVLTALSKYDGAIDAILISNGMSRIVACLESRNIKSHVSIPNIRQDHDTGRLLAAEAISQLLYCLDSHGFHIRALDSQSTDSNDSGSNPREIVPCQYRTGKTLGSGTHAIVKEAVHIETGKYYACKVFNKKFMEGREYMVRNEIRVLKQLSNGHPNIVTLHDHVETRHSLYLCLDLCAGGALFDRRCVDTSYYEGDAAALIRTILMAVQYIHEAGIVHRNLNPKNLLFRAAAEDTDILIAGFSLGRFVEEEKIKLLTEICGTPSYMAPEIFKKAGHGKPVDIWAIGVITYFLLCGHTPFDRDSQQEEMQAIINLDYKFEPAEHWQNVSQTAREFVDSCLTIDPLARPTAAEALKHRWLAPDESHPIPDPISPIKVFDAKKTFRKAVWTIIAMNRLSGHVLPAGGSQLANDITQYKRDTKEENIDEEFRVFDKC